MTLSEKNLDNSLVRFQSKSLPLTTSRLDQINPKPIEKAKHLPAVLSMLMIAAVAGCSGSDGVEELVTFDNIAHALGEFERSMVFIDSAWQRYMSGALEAISDDAKEGSLLFFTSVADGGAGCSACHNGPLFSDGGHHTVAFPQAGPGKGDGNNDDFGRERETGDEVHRYQFRTPSLLNIAQTAPYGHTGAYQTLHDVVRHYVNPNTALDDFFDRGGLCGTPQYQVVADCELLYPDNERNSSLALAKLNEERRAGLSLFQSPRLNNTQVN